jgi:hypothetical protein
MLDLLLSLDAIAAQRGDGLHPVLRERLQRLERETPYAAACSRPIVVGSAANVRATSTNVSPLASSPGLSFRKSHKLR